MASKRLLGGFLVVSGWLLDGVSRYLLGGVQIQVVSRSKWFAGGLQVASSWLPGGLKLTSRYLPGSFLMTLSTNNNLMILQEKKMENVKSAIAQQNRIQ